MSLRLEGCHLSAILNIQYYYSVPQTMTVNSESANLGNSMIMSALKELNLGNFHNNFDTVRERFPLRLQFFLSLPPYQLVELSRLLYRLLEGDSFNLKCLGARLEFSFISRN